MADPAADDELLQYIDEAAARAAGAEPDYVGRSGEPSAAAEGAVSVPEILRHLDEAWAMSGAGTDLPADARMRQVKRAILMALRPVTSYQVPFNRELAVAVKGLAAGLGRIHDLDHAFDSASARLQANLATTELTVDDLADTVALLTETIDRLLVRTDRLEQELAAERAAIRSLRGRQDLVLRTARAAINEPADGRHVADLAAQADSGTEELGEELADITRGTRDEVRADVEAFVSDVVGLGTNAPVVDLGCGRGEWLEALREQGLAAYGVDTSPRLVAAGTERGLDVRQEEATEHLAVLPESSMAAVTGFHLVDRLSSEALVDLVDGALRVLRPAGLLILAAANPTALDVGAADFWLDPARRRPVHPQLLELLVLSRGFAEVEVRWMRPADPSKVLRLEDFAAGDEFRTAALLERLNAALAGPRGYAVVARKPGAG